MKKYPNALDSDSDSDEDDHKKDGSDLDDDVHLYAQKKALPKKVYDE